MLDSELVGELELDAGFEVRMFEGVDALGDVPVLGGFVDARVVDQPEDGQLLQPCLVRFDRVFLHSSCYQP